MGSTRGRGNQIGDRFGLRQVDAAVIKRAHRELAGLGEPGPVGKSQRQDLAGDEHAAMAVDFDDILARVRFGRAEDGNERLVDRLVLVVHKPIRNRMRRLARQVDGKYFIRDRDGLVTTQADDGNRPFLKRCRDRGNRIRKHRRTPFTCPL